MDQQRQSGGYRRLSWRFTKMESPGLVVGVFLLVHQLDARQNDKKKNLTILIFCDSA